MQTFASDVLGKQPYGPVTPVRNALCGVQPNQVAPRDRVEDTLDLCLRVGVQISGRGSTSWPTLQIETQPIPTHSADAPLERAHAAPIAKGAVVHVGAVREIPDPL